MKEGGGEGKPTTHHTDVVVDGEEGAEDQGGGSARIGPGRREEAVGREVDIEPQVGAAAAGPEKQTGRRRGSGAAEGGNGATKTRWRR